MSFPVVELLRAAAAPSLLPPYSEGAPGPRVMYGRFAQFGEWTEIKSPVEGHFMERFQAGAFTRTIAHDRPRMRVLYHHGLDPAIGTKPLGPIRTLAEGALGPEYEVELLDADYVRGLLPALEAGLLGASFRFTPGRSRVERRPVKSPTNPDGLPEVIHLEVKVREFGPTPMPQYAGATAGVRTSALPWWDRV